MARKKQNSSISLPHGRRRVLSPGFFTDSALLALSPLHRIFFEGLWCYADREGRLLDRPIDLKIRILPMDTFDPGAGLDDLHRAGVLFRYRSGPLAIIALKPRAWKEVQHPHPEEPESGLPAPPPEAFDLGGAPPTPDLADRQAAFQNSFPIPGIKLEPPFPTSGMSLEPHVSGIPQPGSSGSSGSSGSAGPSGSTGSTKDVGAEAPAKKPRATSLQEDVHRLFHDTREFELRPRGLFSPDESLKPALINTLWKPLVEAAKASPRPMEVLDTVLDDYFALDWPEDKTPPYPEQVFLSRKVWEPLMANAIDLWTDKPKEPEEEPVQ